jgi:hypothetical protein
MWTEDMELELVRTLRELHTAAVRRVASHQWGEVFVEVAREMVEQDEARQAETKSEAEVAH